MSERIIPDNLYSENAFWGKLKKYAVKLGKELMEKALWLYYVVQDPDVPMRVKTKIYSALGYLILPMDAIPDTIPVVGYSDDLGVLTVAVASVIMYITPDIKRKTQERLDMWFN